MIISNFEVSVGASLGKTNLRTNFQLQITNLEDKEIQFVVETHVAKTQDGKPPLDLLSPRLLYNPSTYSALTAAWHGAGPVWIDSHPFTLGARLSTIFELAPRTLFANDSKNQTLIGHVALRVPPVRQLARFAVSAQCASPVRVLLSASRIDCRDSFMNYVQDMDGAVVGKSSGNDLFSSQSIELSSGKAENEIQCEGLTINNLLEAAAVLHGERGESFPAGALLLPENERLAVLVDLLAAISREEHDLAALNDLLAETSALVRIRPA
jgi:hypothetical protein